MCRKKVGWKGKRGHVKLDSTALDVQNNLRLPAEKQLKPAGRDLQKDKKGLERGRVEIRSRSRAYKVGRTENSKND